MTMPLFWFLRRDPLIGYQFDNALVSDDLIGVRNTRELGRAEDELRDATNSFSRHDVPLPDEFPVPLLGLPDRSFAPDFFSFGIYDFVSRPLRDAMAQPDHVVQYTPVELVRGSAEARAQDYRLLRVLAKQSAMDLERSDCELEEFTHRLTGERMKWPREITRFALLDNLIAKAEIFRIAEIASRVLVTDALAERVLRAGCTGIEFYHPDNRWAGKRVEHYRTTDGIAERRVGFLD
jgi:hypothetical protein